jgi:hypothetical protein
VETENGDTSFIGGETTPSIFFSSNLLSDLGSESLNGEITVTVDQEEPNETDPRIPSPVLSDDGDDDPMGLPPPEYSPPPPQPIPQSRRRATVEDVIDEGDPENFGRFPDPYDDVASGRPAAGKSLQPGETLFEGMRRRQRMDKTTEFLPFLDGDEWDLAVEERKPNGYRGISIPAHSESNLLWREMSLTFSQTKKANLSFHNSRSFLLKVDQLPTGPEWTCKIVTAAGNRLDENDELMFEEFCGCVTLLSA